MKGYIIGMAIGAVFMIGLFSGMLLEQSDDWEKAQLNFDRGIEYSMRYDLKQTYADKYWECNEDLLTVERSITISSGCDISLVGNVTWVNVTGNNVRDALVATGETEVKE